MRARPAKFTPGRLQYGASLIEVLIAVFLFSVGGMAVLQMVIGSMRVNEHTRQIDAASNAARARMEQLLGLQYDSAGTHDALLDRTADGPAGLEAANPTAADWHETVGPYRIYWNLAHNQPVNNTLTISVVATWTDAMGPSQRVVYQTIRVKN